MVRDFLPKVSAASLRKMHKKEENPKAQRRLLACIQRKDGKTIAEIADAMNEPPSTVTDWLRRIKADGLDGLYDIKNKGADCKLDKRQLNSLVKDLDASPAEVGLGAGAWTMPLVRMHIKKKFGVEYHVRSVWDLVLRLGFSRVKPRPHDIRGASPQKAAWYKKKARERNKICVREGRIIVSLDEMHMSLKSIVQYGWHRKKARGANRAKQITVDITGKRPGRATLIGLIGDGGVGHFEFHDAGNIANVREFLLNAHKELGDMLIYTDNASYHSEKMFEELYEETNGGIMVEFLPEYTPELASIELQWREIKRYLANKFFDTIEEMQDAVIDGLRRGIIKIVKVQDFMIV